MCCETVNVMTYKRDYLQLDWKCKSFLLSVHHLAKASPSESTCSCWSDVLLLCPQLLSWSCHFLTAANSRPLIKDFPIDGVVFKMLPDMTSWRVLFHDKSVQHSLLVSSKPSENVLVQLLFLLRRQKFIPGCVSTLVPLGAAIGGSEHTFYHAHTHQGDGLRRLKPGNTLPVILWNKQWVDKKKKCRRCSEQGGAERQNCG